MSSPSTKDSEDIKPIWADLPYFKNLYHPNALRVRPFVPFLARYGPLQSFITAFFAVIMASFLPFGFVPFFGNLYLQMMGGVLGILAFAFYVWALRINRRLGNDIRPLSLPFETPHYGPYRRFKSPILLSASILLLAQSLVLGSSLVALAIVAIHALHTQLAFVLPYHYYGSNHETLPSKASQKEK